MTRLSRKVLLGLGHRPRPSASAARCSSRLKPQHQTTGSELYNTDNRKTPDGLANLATRLYGPAQAGAAARAATARRSRPADPECRRARARHADAGTDPEQQRIAQEQEAARTSHLFATTNFSQTAAAPCRHRRRLSAPRPRQRFDRSHVAGSQARLSQRRRRSPHRQPRSRPAAGESYVLQAGAVIPAALITGLRSDLPGQVTAQVTEDVYDSPTGKFLLIPQGARLSVSTMRRSRSASRARSSSGIGLIMPNGSRSCSSVNPAPTRRLCRPRGRGRQPLGHAVQGRDPLDPAQRRLGSRHQRQRQWSLAEAIRQGTSQSFNQIGQQVVGRSLNVQPTITIRPGFPVRVMVTHDLVLEPYRA